MRDIVQTRDGYLWFTTFDGLVRFDGVRFTVFNKSNCPESGEFFSEERLEEVLACASESSLEESACAVDQEARKFADGAVESDDLTVLLLKHCALRV